MEPNQQPASDQAFTAQLREAVEQYFRAVDCWEGAYQKYYRLPGYEAKITTDLEKEQRAYVESRQRLEALVPRARRLGLKHGIREPWTVLLRTSLGQWAPQVRTGSAIGRNERAAVIECVMLLAAACEEAEGRDEESPEKSRSANTGRSWLQRLVEFFY
jgi:hypothetical protein